jgi:DNA-binding NarL/FixJ family response regulator
MKNLNAPQGIAARRSRQWRSRSPTLSSWTLRIPGDQVTTTVTRIRKISPRTRILVLSMYDAPELVRNLLDLGVSGYLLKNATRHQLVAAIRGAYADDGGIVLFVSRQSLAQIQDGGSGMLSARERDVLELVARALSNAQVASRLSVTEATVKRHLRNIFVKLGAVSRIDAVNKAVAAAQITSPRSENDSAT